MAEEKYITTATLKADRAWTDRLIRKFLAEPDKVAPNPYYRTTGAMRLYALSRVEAIEATEAFAAECATAERRRKAFAKAVITRSINMDAAMEAAEIKIVAGKTCEQIRDLAIQTHGGNYMSDPGPFYFDNRVAVNCIRHNLTNYESLWQSCNRGRTGETAYQILRKRVDERIRETYPEYFDDNVW